MWDVEFSNEFGEWWGTLTEDEQDSLTVSVKLLQAIGPSLARPYADTVKQSRHRGLAWGRAKQNTINLNS